MPKRVPYQSTYAGGHIDGHVQQLESHVQHQAALALTSKEIRGLELAADPVLILQIREHASRFLGESGHACAVTGGTHSPTRERAIR
jgi:hypothetical protein